LSEALALTMLDYRTYSVPILRTRYIDWSTPWALER
jgi:hypothetical protein